MSGSELVPVGGPDNAAASVGEEDARQFILRVKQTVERCLAQGMNKAQMFRAIREEGLEPGAAFAVYKELRHQNRGFFEEYYSMIDLKEQRQRLDRLVHAYRTGGDRDAEDGACVPEMTVTPLVAVEETGVPDVNVEWPDRQQALHFQAWLSGGGGHQFAPAAWPQQAVADLPDGEQVPNHGHQVADPVGPGVALPHQQEMDLCHLPVWEQLHNHEQPLSNGAFQGAAWPQQALHLPTAQQLHNHEEMAADGGFRGLVWPQQEVMLQNGQLLHDQQQQPAANGGLLQGLAWPQQAVQFPAAQLHYHEQAVANGLPPMTSAAGLHNDAMMDPCSVSHNGQSFWQGQQAGTLEQWLRGASVNPSPSSSLSQPPENQQY